VEKSLPVYHSECGLSALNNQYIVQKLFFVYLNSRNDIDTMKILLELASLLIVANLIHRDVNWSLFVHGS